MTPAQRVEGGLRKTKQKGCLIHEKTLDVFSFLLCFQLGSSASQVQQKQRRRRRELKLSTPLYRSQDADLTSLAMTRVEQRDMIPGKALQSKAGLLAHTHWERSAYMNSPRSAHQ